jgi:hypothetical protein
MFMEIVVDLIKIIIPASLVLYGMYSVVQAFLQKQIEQIVLNSKNEASAVVLPIQLQAFERMSLYLERISPNNLLLRLSSNGFQVSDFQQVLLQEVRNEFNHNLAQQIYISDEVWKQIKFATDDLLSKIALGASDLKPDQAAIELSKKLITLYSDKEENLIQMALLNLKKEIQQKFI